MIPSVGCTRRLPSSEMIRPRGPFASQAIQSLYFAALACNSEVQSRNSI